MREHVGDPSHEVATVGLLQAVENYKSKFVHTQSPYTVSFYRQVVNWTKRNFWLLFNNWEAIDTKAWVSLLNAFLVGSLFYDMQEDNKTPRSKALATPCPADEEAVANGLLNREAQSRTKRSKSFPDTRTFSHGKISNTRYRTITARSSISTECLALRKLAV